ncbi:hypothetical protein D3C76_1558900 [compost metagenome]
MRCKKIHPQPALNVESKVAKVGERDGIAFAGESDLMAGQRLEGINSTPGVGLAKYPTTKCVFFWPHAVTKVVIDRRIRRFAGIELSKPLCLCR